MRTLARVILSISIGFSLSAEAHAQAEAFFGVTRNQGIDASSYNANSFVITNESSSGVLITDIEIDFATSMFPDMVFDPNGTAGDTAARCFLAGNGASATGLVAPADECEDPFSVPHQDGFFVLSLEFNDFDPDETFSFAVDADPTSIRGTSGQGGNSAGSVSGLELTGATFQVTFSNGTTRTGKLFRQTGFNGGAECRLRASPPATPGLTAVGVSSPATVFTASQTMRVTGPAGADVRLLRVEGRMDDNGGSGFDVDPFEANRAIVVEEKTGSIGGNGQLDINVTLTRGAADGGFNYFAAVLVSDDGSGRTGLTSPVVVLELGDGCDSNSDCADGNPCTNDVCGSGECSNPNNTANCNDGIFCNGPDQCSGGSCSDHDGDPCAGGGQCADGCNEAADTCNDPVGTACTGDGNPCTDDQCNGNGSCVHPNNDDPCDDGVFCNGDDSCAGGSCAAHDGDPFVGGAVCADECDEDADACATSAGTTCTDDDNPCTDDECNGAGGCDHVANTASCDDGNACTTGDACAGTDCVGGAAVDCDDDLACNGTESCQPGSGCVAGEPFDCSELDSDCSVGNCVEDPADCIATPANEGEPCADARGCAAEGECQDGTCVGDSVCDAECEACGESSACVSLCGHPVSDAEGPVLASDALFALQAAVQIIDCALCVCDVNDDGKVAATDSLTVLTRSVTPETVITCPPPGAADQAPTTTSTTLP